MRYRSLGRSGLRTSVLGLGCSQLGSRVSENEGHRLIRSAMDAGVSLFDTANVYGGGASEEALGRALRGVRDQAVIATKVRWAVGTGANDRGASRIHIKSAVEASLRRLGTDRIDLYQIHAPDPVTPLEETLSVLDNLVTTGKVLYIGVSNFAGWQLVDAHWRATAAGRTPIISTQSAYSLLDLRAENEILPAAEHLGVGFLACLVLARGYLAGAFGDDTDPASLTPRRRAYLTGPNRRKRELAAEFGAEHGMGIAEVAIRVIADAPGVSGVLVGATTSVQVQANASALSSPLPSVQVSDLLSALRRADIEPAQP